MWEQGATEGNASSAFHAASASNLDPLAPAFEMNVPYTRQARVFDSQPEPSNQAPPTTNRTPNKPQNSHGAVHKKPTNSYNAGSGRFRTFQSRQSYDESNGSHRFSKSNEVDSGPKSYHNRFSQSEEQSKVLAETKRFLGFLKGDGDANGSGVGESQSRELPFTDGQSEHSNNGQRRANKGKSYYRSRNNYYYDQPQVKDNRKDNGGKFGKQMSKTREEDEERNVKDVQRNGRAYNSRRNKTGEQFDAIILRICIV